MRGYQGVEVCSGIHTLLNNLFDKVLFELAILAIKVVAFVAR
jgi:hypothetical protein